MRLINCAQCGANDFIRENGYMVCRFCNSRYAIEKGDIGITDSTIALGDDVDALLAKCRQYPKKAKKYANLVLDIDPDNREALKYI